MDTEVMQISIYILFIDVKMSNVAMKTSAIQQWLLPSPNDNLGLQHCVVAAMNK